MQNLVPDDDEDKRPEQVKNFIKCSNFLGLNEDEALEIILKTCKKFKLNTEWKGVITKLHKRLKSEAADKNSISNEGQKNETGNDVEIELIKSLATQIGKGFLACETWINNNKLNIAKIQPEILAKKLSDPRSKKYTHNDFILGIKEKFKLSVYETDEADHKILSINTKYHSESKRLINILKRLQTYSLKARKAAEKLLLKGNPLPFIINTWKKSHVGDESVGKTLPVCAASAFITGNNAGLPLIIIGPSGKGKSDAVNDFFDLLPPSIALRTGFSDKYLYYSNDILPGSVSFLDDKELTGAFKELAKNLQTNFQVPVEYRTVIDGEPIVLTAPERNVLISSSVEGNKDVQMDNRCLQCEIDSTEEQDIAVSQQQRQKEIANTSKSFKLNVETCKCIFDILSLLTYQIKIPFAEAVKWNHTHNRRNQPKFFDIIRAVCLYKINQRPYINGYFLASLEDYDEACKIYKHTTVQTNTNLSKSEQNVLETLYNANKKNGFYKIKPLDAKKAVRMTYEDIAAAVGLAKDRVRHILTGKEGKEGLTSKVVGLGSEGSNDGKHKKVFYYTGNIDFKRFETFSSLIKNDEEIIKIISESLKKLQDTQIEENEIIKEAFKDLAEYMPALPVISLYLSNFNNSSSSSTPCAYPVPSKKVLQLKEENTISIINNIVNNRYSTLFLENVCESNFLDTNSKIKEVKSPKNVCKKLEYTLSPEKLGTSTKNKSTDNEIPCTFAKVQAGTGGTTTTTDTENKKVLQLSEITEKIQEYIRKECNGSAITKSIDTHINDFRKLYPEFKHESRQHLEYAFNKVLKSSPPLDKSQQKESTLQKPPAVEKKGIAILKKALQAEKVEATL